ncbi:MAG: metallophosphoesterase [Bacteroidetes bacterium]|nr:metallophosphoesterase [Bacteroidota bacterium]
MLAFLGDIHGSMDALIRAHDYVKKQKHDVTAIIQVGDFGFYHEVMPKLQRIKPKIPIYAIDGNHEDHSIICDYTEVTEIGPNIFFVPRGTVMELDGRKIGFIGGAASVDKKWRLENGHHWSWREQITDEDIAKFDEITELDILVAHCPPQCVIMRNFDQSQLQSWFGLPYGWIDPSAISVEALWNRLGRPKMFVGHMHRWVEDESVTILDINQVKFY